MCERAVAESAFEGVSALLDESADVDAMPGKPRFLPLPPRLGSAVLISLPIDRDRLGVSRLIHNLKRHACDLAKAPAPTGP